MPDVNRMNQLKICTVILLALLPAASADANYRSERWANPLTGKLIVVRGFDGAAYQANHYGRAHRGVDLLSKVGDPVFAPADGVVGYVGVINSIPIVVIAHPNNGATEKGLRTTYLPVETHLIVGDAVGRSKLIGVVGAQTHLAGRTVLHWGERLNREYKNPLRRLGAPVLLPRLS